MGRATLFAGIIPDMENSPFIHSPWESLQASGPNEGEHRLENDMPLIPRVSGCSCFTVKDGEANWTPAMLVEEVHVFMKFALW